ncbi:MAG TPA: RagB/SusD family nutrient uptake outer membrane protein, partial [Niabella sp.]|nr:RagB/SusD family nutrient uptake outer membrane protein [Niabella sp.]
MRCKIFFIALAVLLLASCKKLNETPFSFVEPGAFYNTPAQVEAALTASMNKIWDFWYGYQYPGLHNFKHDDQLLGGDLVIPNNFASDIWANHYAALLDINTAIAAMKKGSLGNTPQTEQDKVLGQALFLRAFNYFMLVRLYGGVPLLLENDDPIANPPARTSVEEVYKSITDDLSKAAGLLPRTWPDSHKALPTRGAALGLLAKAYLTMATAPLNQTEYYAKAAEAAQKVIAEGDYRLIHDIDKVFTVDTRYGPEVMFTFSSNYQDITVEPFVWMPYQLDGWGDFYVQPQWAEALPDIPRKHAYILLEIDGVHYDDWVDGGVPSIKKYMYDKAEDIEAWRSLVVFPILRYADVLLIFAEAENMAKGGPTQAAVDAVNQVIDRANDYQNLPQHPRASIAMSKQAFDDLVIEERNQELCFELGDRWFDL